MPNRVSIAMCTYNGALFLKEQLESVLNQLTLPDELVICDDGSTDDTVEIIETFKAHSTFLVQLYKNETGTPLGSTRNFERAISLCSGDVILLSDQDDVWLPNKVSSLVEAIESGADIAFSNANLVDEQLKPLNRDLFDSLALSYYEKLLLKRGKLFEVLIRRNIVTGAGMAFSSKYLKLVLPISLHWVHDGWIALLIAHQGKFKIINEKLFLYRQHSNNQIGAKKISIVGKIKKVSESSNSYYPNLLKGFLDAKLRLQLADLTTSNFQSTLLIDRKISYLNKKVGILKLKHLAVLFLTIDLITGSYHRYSRGFVSYLRDIVIFFAKK